MNNNINIAEILKDFPKGTKLYSPIFGEVKFNKYHENIITILSTSNDGRDTLNTFSKNGSYYSGYSQSECLLFPSLKMRDWTKFFKRGDVVIKNGGGMAVVFDGWANDAYTEFNTTVNLYCDNNTGEEEVCDTLLFRKATEEERKQFVKKAERILNGKYNPETLQVETVKPECPFKSFDKVLIRDSKKQIWIANYFSLYYEEDKDYPYVCMGGSYRYCIPYNEHTAHLLGTADPYAEGGSE